MDRLTVKTFDDCICYRVENEPEGLYDILDLAMRINDGDGEEAGILVEVSKRLAAYEDIGLTPEQIYNLISERNV